MRRKVDKLVLTCVGLAVLCTIVTVVVVAPVVLDTSKAAADANRAADAAQRVAENNRRLIERIDAEGRERRDQSCLLFERGHLADVKQLRRTYAFLARQPRSERGTVLIKAVVSGLPQLERQARVDTAPDYCDEAGVGLPEPDPKVPKRRDFSYLLHP